MVFVKSASESWAWEEMKWVFQPLWGSGCWACSWQRRVGDCGFQHRDWELREPLSPWRISLISEDSSGHPYKVCHPSTPEASDILSADRRGDLGTVTCIIRTSGLWSEQATETFSFSLGREACTLEKSWQFIHFAPSWSQPMSDCRDSPLMLSSESALLWKKFYPSKLKGNISHVQLLAVTCLPFFGPLAWCHPQARKPTSLPFCSSQSYPQCRIHSQCPYNIDTEKENSAGSYTAKNILEIFSSGNLFCMPFLFCISTNVFSTNPKFFDISQIHLNMASTQFLLKIQFSLNSPRSPDQMKWILA